MSEVRLADCLERLNPVLQSLSFGEQPQYGQLDPEVLRGLEPEMGFVVRSLATSGAADQKIAAFQLMGLLDREDFVRDLSAGVDSAQQWERIEAIRALGRMTHPRAHAILRRASKHPELQTRRAASAALKAWGG